MSGFWYHLKRAFGWTPPPVERRPAAPARRPRPKPFAIFKGYGPIIAALEEYGQIQLTQEELYAIKPSYRRASNCLRAKIWHALDTGAIITETTDGGALIILREARRWRLKGGRNDPGRISNASTSSEAGSTEKTLESARSLQRN